MNFKTKVALGMLCIARIPFRLFVAWRAGEMAERRSQQRQQALIEVIEQ
jgi:hypothetical protein